MITGDGSAPIENSAFIVERDRFTQVGRNGQVPIPAGARRVSLTGKTVIPGKVDLHGHIGYQHDWDGTMAKEYFTRENLIDHRNSRKINMVYIRGQQLDRAGLRAKWQARWRK